MKLNGNIHAIFRRNAFIESAGPCRLPASPFTRVEADDGLSIVSSGIYERYFKTKDGTLYHHILNPKTGYSYDNDLMAVTILSKKSVDGDGLSTSCFAMGKKEGLAFINNIDGVEAVFITKDEKMHYSKGFSKYLYQQK